MKIRHALPVLTLITAAPMLASVAPATSQVATAPTTEIAPKDAETCVLNLESNETTCYEHTIDMLGGAETRAAKRAARSAGVEPEEVDDPDEIIEEYEARAGRTIIGILYKLPDYDGQDLVLEVRRGCGTNDSVDWQIGELGSYWNDDLMSAKSGLQKCQTKVFEHREFRGASLGYFHADKPSLGALNNQVTAIKWR